MHEFSLIAKYFARAAPNAVLGVGDDCALVAPTHGHQLAITTDTLVDGVHFFTGTDARKLGHKALAVNLSDLAAMGATPHWATLAITLPAVDSAWLAEFAAGLFALADNFHVSLIGGDTTRGPLSITLTAIGEVPIGQALYRHGAQIGDDVWVSGDLGGPPLAVAERYGKLPEFSAVSQSVREQAHLKLDHPQPRVALGIALRGVAHAAIDVSDGLVQDLHHIVARSSHSQPLAAHITLPSLPLHPACAALRTASPQATWHAALAGGDEYELAFTAPLVARERVTEIAKQTGVACTRIGEIVASAKPQVLVIDASNAPMLVDAGGFNHFT